MIKIIDGGINNPKVPEPARLPNKIFSGYFLFLNSGIDILPTVATVAADEPDIHRISNDTDSELLNLHVYTPPLGGFRVYDAAE